MNTPQQGIADPLLTIVLVNYNGQNDLPPCLDSIRAFAPPDAQVIVVDNASEDDSRRLLQEQYPWVTMIASKSNLGFARGNNLATASIRGSLLLLLNTDTVLMEPLAPLLAWFSSETDYGAATIHMLDGQGESAACTGRFPTPLRLALLRSMLIAPSTLAAHVPVTVDWVQGSFLLTRTDLWRRTGGLDESYFMYMEDVDYCKRLALLGARSVYYGACRYTHFGGYNVARFPDQVRGLQIYCQRHFSPPDKLAAFCVLLLGCLLRVTVAALSWLGRRNEASRVRLRACQRALAVVLGVAERRAA